MSANHPARCRPGRWRVLVIGLVAALPPASAPPPARSCSNGRACGAPARPRSYVPADAPFYRRAAHSSHQPPRTRRCASCSAASRRSTGIDLDRSRSTTSCRRDRRRASRRGGGVSSAGPTTSSRGSTARSPWRSPPSLDELLSGEMDPMAEPAAAGHGRHHRRPRTPRRHARASTASRGEMALPSPRRPTRAWRCSVSDADDGVRDHR